MIRSSIIHASAIVAGLLLTTSAGYGDNVRDSVFKIDVSASYPDMFRPWRIGPPTETGGTGVLIAENRILTNAHVVSHAQEIYITPHGSSERLDATIEFIATECDLAIVAVDEPVKIAALKPVELMKKKPEIQSQVSAFGFPVGGDELSVTQGVVSRIEYGPYRAGFSALRIQVDAAINPGNSGGPCIQDDKIAGLVFSNRPDNENIGYVIPAEVITHFLNDCDADGKYDGFPMIGVAGVTLENPTVRKYLKLADDQTGVVLHRIHNPAVEGILQPWDVVTECNGVDIDNQAMIRIEGGIRVSWAYLVSSEPPGSTMTLKIVRAGKQSTVQVPTATTHHALIRRMAADRPTYFIYGGLVFTPVTTELTQRLNERLWSYLGQSGAMLVEAVVASPESPDEEMVVVPMPILPHKLTKGYGVRPLSALTHVNDTPVRNMRHLIQLIKENTEEFVVFRFENERQEKIVLDPKDVQKHQKEILRRNNIPSTCSDDLMDLCP